MRDNYVLNLQDRMLSNGRIIPPQPLVQPHKVARVNAKSGGPEPAVGNMTAYVTLYFNVGQLASHPVLLNGKWTCWSPQVKNLALTSPC